MGLAESAVIGTVVGTRDDILRTSRRGGRRLLQDLLKKPYMNRNQESETLKTERPSAPRSVTKAENVVFLVKTNVKKHLETGKANFDEGNPIGAKECYEKALDIDPTCAIAYFYLGFTHHEMGNTELAKDYYFQAIDLEPKQSLFLEHLARLHFELGEYSVCLVRFQEAHSVGMLQPISYGLMGRGFFELDRYTEATDCLEKMLEIEEEPSLRKIAFYYAILAYLSEGSIFPARKLANRLLGENEVDPIVYSVLAERFQDNRCLSVAKQLLEKISAESQDLETRLEHLEYDLEQAESFIPELYSCEEESLLHHLHHLAQYGSEKVHRVLISLVQSPSQLVREGILSYCRRFGFEVPKGVLKECLNDTDLVHEATLRYVASTYDRAFMDLLIANINHRSREVQSAVARYLERRGGPIHLPLLEGQMEIAEGAGIRRQLQRAINQIKRRHTEQTERLATHSGQFRKTSNLRARRDWQDLFQWLGGSVVVAYLLYRIVQSFW